MKRKIVLFGGTFDPVHNGHTIVAAGAAREIGAEKLFFIPARRSPHKQLLPQADACHRVKMIDLAIAGIENFAVSCCELDRPEPSYTLQTVRQFKVRFGPDAQIYWLVGADSLDELPHWYEIKKVIDECKLSVMFRAGFARPDFTRFIEVLGEDRAEKLRQNVIETPLVDISSSEIRKRLARSEDVKDMLHPAVLAYVRENHLYRPKDRP